MKGDMNENQGPLVSGHEAAAMNRCPKENNRKTAPFRPFLREIPEPTMAPLARVSLRSAPCSGYDYKCLGRKWGFWE